MKIQPSTKLFKTKYPYRVTRTRNFTLETTSYETEKFSEVLDIARESWFDPDRDITASILYPEVAWGNRGDTNWYYIQNFEMLKDSTTSSQLIEVGEVKYLLSEQRRIFKNESHYFDHPKIGIIISVYDSSL